MKKCSFTGHRVIFDEHYARLDSLLSRAIEYVYSEGCREFYTGGALGFDTMAAKKLIAYRITHNDVRLIVVVPCENQAEKWSSKAKEVYDFILANADEVVFCSEQYTKDCMKRRNEYLVEVCDVLIAYSGRAMSGSAQTVRMATAKGKTVYNLYRSAAKETED